MTLIYIIIIAIVCVFAFFLFRSKDDNKKTNNQNNNGKEENKEELKGVKRKNELAKMQKKDLFDFMEFDNVEDDMIIQNNGSRFTMIIQCKGINYDLMSSVEQLAVEEGFIVFLNTLKYPIQIYVQARSVDLKKSMNIYNQRVKIFEKQYGEADEMFRKKINTLDATEDDIDAARNERAKFANLYEYAQDINKYVEKLSLNKNILQRKFFIAISYSKNEITANNNFSKEEIYEICRRELYTRANSLISSLMTCSVVGRILTSEELFELLFVSYNRDDERLYDVESVLDSDFYRLYSTSKDIYDKKRETIQEEVEKEALQRVQEAIKQTAREDRLRTPEEAEDEFEEAADREAINIIRQAEIDRDTKEALTNVIAENHVINARERANARAKRKERELEERNLYSEDEQTNNIDSVETNNNQNEENLQDVSNIGNTSDTINIVEEEPQKIIENQNIPNDIDTSNDIVEGENLYNDDNSEDETII